MTTTSLSPWTIASSPSIRRLRPPHPHSCLCPFPPRPGLDSSQVSHTGQNRRLYRPKAPLPAKERNAEWSGSHWPVPGFSGRACEKRFCWSSLPLSNSVRRTACVLVLRFEDAARLLACARARGTGSVAMDCAKVTARVQLAPAELRIDSRNRKSGHSRNFEGTVVCADRRDAARESRDSGGHRSGRRVSR